MAEREGFEPPIALRLCLISSQVHSTGLCHLSALFTTSYEKKLESSFCHWQFRWHLRTGKSAPLPPACDSRCDGRIARSSVPSSVPKALQPCANPLRPSPVYLRKYGDCNATCNL